LKRVEARAPFQGSPVRDDIFVELYPNIFKLRQERHKNSTPRRKAAKYLIEFSLVPLRLCAFALIPVLADGHHADSHQLLFA
jgi:hypothetical protein